MLYKTNRLLSHLNARGMLLPKSKRVTANSAMLCKHVETYKPLTRPSKPPPCSIR